MSIDGPQSLFFFFCVDMFLFLNTGSFFFPSNDIRNGMLGPDCVISIA